MAFVEHLVLFRLKKEVSNSQEEEWLHSLNNLKSLDGILYFRAARIAEISGTFSFTHALYARFSGKAALAHYSPHPEHLKVVEIGRQICDDFFGLDWETNDASQVGDGPKVFMVVKLKDGVDSHVLLEVASVCAKQASQGRFVSAGSDFSKRGRGFDFGYLLGTCSDCPPDQHATALKHLQDELAFLQGAIDSFLESSFVVQC
ncbi:stress-response A/B barrel domain-containing protein UP3-like [Selaginella moellendorffii]|uniref:stress-response A/B barrel domain-containing protein UP3-like n=1 Tax=Selaginella moellendorffii TaxID=88036 RepID=UPI000D1CD25C|nr:stress-response A/B barrel domain-containing protein UP3-like [Selaginella moellendorffii]|eukprot:XP_024543819.1 stress-response A/B barrel domain-containing protein UP3-like [Selaginella moellendorffii]